MCYNRVTVKESAKRRKENNTMTKRENFTAIVSVLESANRVDLADVMRHELELLDKKNASKKPTSVQVANESLKNVILNYVTDVPMTATEIMAAIPEITSNQKASALLNQMVKAGTLNKVVEKRKSYFVRA